MATRFELMVNNIKNQAVLGVLYKNILTLEDCLKLFAVKSLKAC